jgi:Xaa-Pro aminopeptidase
MAINLENMTERRKNLTDQVNFLVILWSGNTIARNFLGNIWPFRAISHFFIVCF